MAVPMVELDLLIRDHGELPLHLHLRAYIMISHPPTPSGY